MTTTSKDDDGVIESFARKYGLPPGKVIGILGATCFRMDKEGTAPTLEQSIALMVVCNVYDLNPFTKEIFAFPDKKGIIPVVSVDGWIRLINSHSQFNGVEFSWSQDWVDEEFDPVLFKGLKKQCPSNVKVSIFRKDRDRPTTIEEYLDEVYKAPSSYGPGPWQSHPKRFLRHKGLIQCARIAFGFAGIYDDDEAQNILRGLDANGDTPASTLEQPEELPAATKLPDPPTSAVAATTINAIIEETQSLFDTKVEAEPTVTKSEPVAEVKEEPKVKAAETKTEVVVDMATGEIVSGAPVPVPAPAPAAQPAAAPAQEPAKPKTAPKGSELLSEAKRKYLEVRMSFNGVDEDQIQHEFGVSLAEVRVDQLATIGNWIEEKGGS